MRNPSAKPTQEYIKLWKECKTAGIIDTHKILEQQTGLITSDTTIYDILLKMEAIGKVAFEEKRIETRNVTGILHLLYMSYYTTLYPYIDRTSVIVKFWIHLLCNILYLYNMHTFTILHIHYTS